ncbi:putative holin-like toxin [Listeria kieliensis]
MSIAEAMQLMLGFGSFILSFVGLVVVLIKLNDHKKK